MSGSTALNEMPESVSGAILRATASSTAAAIQTGTKPAPIIALLTSEVSRCCLHVPAASVPAPGFKESPDSGVTVDRCASNGRSQRQTRSAAMSADSEEAAVRRSDGNALRAVSGAGARR